MSAGRPIVFGEVLFDRFPDGSEVLGGAPLNVAWHLQAFGAEPLLITRVGDDPAGRRARQALGTWGLDDAGLQVDPSHPTGSVEVSLDEGQPSYDIVGDRAYDHIAAEGLPDARDAALLYHGSLALRGASARALARLAAGLDVAIFVDVNLRDPWWKRDAVRARLDGARAAKLNADELGRLAPELPAGDAGAEALRRAHGLELLVLTRGAEGAACFSDAGCTEVRPTAAVQVLDAVGAGDAFASVLILGQLRGWPLAATLERAQHFASALVGVRGALVHEREFYAPFQQAWGLDGAGG